VSAIAPPSRPNTTSGTKATSDAKPTQAELPVMSKICCWTATAVNCAPMTVATWPRKSLR